LNAQRDWREYVDSNIHSLADYRERKQLEGIRKISIGGLYSLSTDGVLECNKCGHSWKPRRERVKIRPNVMSYFLRPMYCIPCEGDRR
jgi:hypothetical protein